MGSQGSQQTQIGSVEHQAHLSNRQSSSFGRSPETFAIARYALRMLLLLMVLSTDRLLNVKDLVRTTMRDIDR